MTKLDIKSMNLQELKDYLLLMHEKTFHAEQIYHWIHKKLCNDFMEMTDISKNLKEKLMDTFSLYELKEADKAESKLDGTCKYLFELQDNHFIECVLMQYKHGISACISTQAGCRMGCVFCASAIGGLSRNLEVSELLESVYKLSRLSPKRISNLVLMGTGEPFDNYDNVVKFIKMISDNKGLNISQRNITVSTCGIIQRIRDFAEEGFSVTLALSLHAPNDEIRKKLMPSASQNSLDGILSAFDYYFEKTGRRNTFEYSMMAGINDRIEDAYALGRLLKGRASHVNLIPVNPVKERKFKRSSRENILNFKNILEKYKINVTIRREMGTDIDAACGQLRRRHIIAKEVGLS